MNFHIEVGFKRGAHGVGFVAGYGGGGGGDRALGKGRHVLWM